MTPYYEDAHVEIFCGDCRDVLSWLRQVDHVVTDPPFDEKTHAGARTSKRRQSAIKAADNRLGIDFDPLDVAAVAPVLLAAATRWVVAFCALEMLGDYKRASVESWIRAGVWRRHSGPQFTGDRPAQGAEGVAIMHRPGRKAWNGGGDAAFWDYPVERDDRCHPTQKPLPLMVALVNAFSDPGDLILDPFAGSGTTLVAAKRMGRRAIGIELDEKYAAHAARRVAATQPLTRLEFEDDSKRKQADMFGDADAA